MPRPQQPRRHYGHRFSKHAVLWCGTVKSWTDCRADVVRTRTSALRASRVFLDSVYGNGNGNNLEPKMATAWVKRSFLANGDMNGPRPIKEPAAQLENAGKTSTFSPIKKQGHLAELVSPSPT
jgi:hypothetical protein